MASGRKNYFRHSTSAFEDPKIQKAIDLLGYEGYAYYFILLEILAKQCENECKETIEIHQQTLRIVWRKSQQSCNKVVTKLAQSGLFVVTFKESLYEFSIPNLSKYMGKYETKLYSNTPNKRKEKEIKEKKKNIKKKPTPIFSDEPPALEENTNPGQSASTILTMLNSICFKNFRPTEHNLKFINARLREKFTIKDFSTVIKFKLSEWGSEKEMAQYLRPETLFGNKFESYLEAARSVTLPSAVEAELKARADKLFDFSEQEA